jgi:hypothetical protein
VTLAEMRGNEGMGRSGIGKVYMEFGLRCNKYSEVTASNKDSSKLKLINLWLVMVVLTDL